MEVGYIVLMFNFLTGIFVPNINYSLLRAFLSFENDFIFLKCLLKIIFDKLAIVTLTWKCTLVGNHFI